MKQTSSCPDLFGYRPAYLLLNCPSTPAPQLDPQSWKILYDHNAASPSCFVFAPYVCCPSSDRWSKAKRLKMTQFSCVGVESDEGRSLSGLTAGAQGHDRSSDLTQRMKQTLSQQLTDFHWRLQKHRRPVFNMALQSSLLTPKCPSFFTAVAAIVILQELERRILV